MAEAIEYRLFLISKWLATRLPYNTASRFGATLGSLTFHLLRYRRKLTLENLRHAFPELSAGERKRFALGAYKNYGTSILQMLWASGQQEEDLKKTLRIRNFQIVEPYLTGPTGLILLSGHYGCWEFIIHGLRLHLGRPVVTIVKKQSNKRIDVAVDAGRRRHGNITISMGPGSREALKALKEGRILCALGDQSGPKESVFVNFFGRPAATHRGVAAFSLRTGAPIVMVFLIRQEDETYEAVFEEVDRSGLEEYNDENIDELTRRHAALLEKYVRLHPDHWLWMHKRWKHTEYYEWRQPMTQVS